MRAALWFCMLIHPVFIAGIAALLFFASRLIHFPRLAETIVFKGGLFLAFPLLLFLTRAISREDVGRAGSFVARRLGLERQ